MIARLKNRFNALRDLPASYRIAGMMSIASPLLRNITTPAMVYDLYTDVQTVNPGFTLADVFDAGQLMSGLNDPYVQAKTISYGVAWAALHAVQWGGGAYAGYGIGKSLMAKTVPQANPS